MKHFLLAFFLLLLTALPHAVHAGEPTFAEPVFSETVFKVLVISAEEPQERQVLETSLTQLYQSITTRILEGPRKGEVITIENDTPGMLRAGDVLYLHRLPETLEGPEMWSVGESDRGPTLLMLLALFVLVTVMVAGMQGFRSLVALAGSFALIIFALLPALSHGYPPALTSVVMGVMILAFSMFVTHGVNRPTWVALWGSVVALGFSAILAQVAVTATKLTGFVSDEAVSLNFATGGTLSLSGLLLGGILVGIIGVLNDVSVSQVHTVAELHEANKSLSRSHIWKRAMKVGREHMAAVVNTLPLAYAGVSLPLLLLFSQSDAPISFIINREIFAAEVVRALAGSIGLILSGAIATALAVLFLVPSTQHGIIEKSSKYKD